MSDPIATVQASTPRRFFGMFVMGALGGLLIYLALATPQVLWGQIMLLVFGCGSLFMMDWMRRATIGRLDLTEQGIFDQDGKQLAAIDDITGVDRGHFAIKPSNGFVVRLKTRAPRAWAPGLWWRNGRRLGVGGVTSAPQSKFMADALVAMLAERDN